MHRLNVADSVSHFQADGSVFDGTELLAHVSVMVGSGDCPHDGGVVEFLGVVDLVAAGVAGGVEMADVFDVGAQSADDVAPPYLRAYKHVHYPCPRRSRSMA